MATPGPTEQSPAVHSPTSLSPSQGHEDNIFIPPTETKFSPRPSPVERTSEGNSEVDSDSDKNDVAAVPGSMDCPYRLAIVGGGPAGTSIIVRAIHLDIINELCSFGARKDAVTGALRKQAGVCLFDSSSEQRLGGGRLQDYIINSNTFGGKFVTNVTQDKPNVLPPEKASGTVLESLDKSNMAAQLAEYGSKVAPLSDIGVFLVEVGRQVKRLLDFYRESSSYECCSEVTQLQQSECKQFWKVTTMNLKTQMTSETYACQVVLATGGTQRLPRLSPSSRNKKLMSSDQVCTLSGVEELKSRLEKKEKKKIVIIGGSHSAFSAAWVCLNKLTVFSTQFQIYIIHRTPVKVFYGTKREAERDKYYDYDAPNKCGQIHPFGGLRGDAKDLYRSVKRGEETRIRMLCTGADGSAHHTMAGKLQEEAGVIVWACGYAANTSFRVLDNHGGVIKLKLDRGQVVVNDQAQVMRVPLSSLSLPAPASVPAPTTLPTALSAVATALTENKPMPVLSDVLHPDGSCVAAGDSDAVVTEPLVTTANTVGDTPATKPPHLTRQPRNSEDFEPQPVGNLLGTGLGFGLSLGNNSSESAKADGVAVYLKRGATLILSHVVGNKVFGDNAESWEQHVAVNLKKCAVLALEQQALEKLQQLDYERSPDGGLTLSAEHVTSPKKSTRRIMFDPSSPSNASTGIGVGIGFSPSPIRRNIATAPHCSSRRHFNRSSSSSSNNNNNSSQRISSQGEVYKPSRSNNIRSTSSNSVVSTKKPAERAMTSNGKSEKRNNQHSMPGNSIYEPPPSSNQDQNQVDPDEFNVIKHSFTHPDITVDSDADFDGDIASGVSVLAQDGARDHDRHPPPSFCSEGRAQETFECTALCLPQVTARAEGSSAANAASEKDTKLESAKQGTLNTSQQSCVSETFSRLCQPKKSFLRSPNTSKSGSEKHKGASTKATKAPKAASEFSFDIPSITQQKGGSVLSRVGSDNIHVELVCGNNTESDNILLSPKPDVLPGVSSPARPPSASNNTGIDSVNKVSPASPARRPAISRRKHTRDRPTTNGTGSRGYSNCNKDTTTTNIHSCLDSSPKKDQSNGGPSVADLMWAKERNSRSSGNPKRIQKSSKSAGATRFSHPLSPPSSSGNNTDRIRTSTGRSRSSVSRTHSGNSPVHTETRSPVPASAPLRSRRLLSQSLNGPPVAMLKLPALGEVKEGVPFEKKSPIIAPQQHSSGHLVPVD